MHRCGTTYWKYAAVLHAGYMLFLTEYMLLVTCLSLAFYMHVSCNVQALGMDCPLVACRLQSC